MMLSNMLNMEFVHALNPLYVFPIVAVIFCVFIVYAVGFKSPAQPPSFDGIEVEKKISKKKKSKENNKGKVAQNGKANGNVASKAPVSPINKKKDTEKSVSSNEHVEKSPVNAKKTTKKAKQVNEKKVLQEKKEILHDDVGEDGWVQLVSKKGRKNRKDVKKDESSTSENQKVIPKLTKASEDHSNISNPHEDSLDKGKDTVKTSKPEIKPSLQEDKENIVKIPVEPKKEVVKDSSLNTMRVEEETEKSVSDKSSSKVKKKKKKNTDTVIADDSIASSVEPPAVKIVSNTPAPKADKKSPNVVETKQNVVETKQNVVESKQNVVETKQNVVETKQNVVEITTDKIEENNLKESKASNVVFDELADLYTEPKEQRKKKKVRRDH